MFFFYPYYYYYFGVMNSRNGVSDPFHRIVYEGKRPIKKKDTIHCV